MPVQGFPAIFSELEIGSNKQKVQVIADTGSTILWVPDSNVICYTLPNQTPFDCTDHGTFDTDDSKTFEFTSDDMEGDYLDGSTMSGIWGLDDIHVGNSTVQEFEFGVANETSQIAGVLGLGFYDDSELGDSLSLTLQKQGLINRNAYSVFLNEINSTGTILFGAVDHSKCADELQTVPIVYNKTNPEINVNVLGIDVVVGNQTFKGPINKEPYLLDTGTALTQLPNWYLNVLEKELNATFNETQHSITFDGDCSQLNDISYSIRFDGKTIKVPVSSLYHESHDGQCELMVNSDPKSPIIGVDFLRSMYFVVDLDDREVSLAQAKYSKEQEIELFPQPGVNRTTGNKSEKQVSSSSVVGVDILLCLVVLFTWLV
ncbi:Candidapepsin-10 [Spathaspora sp. JA1]|nr:Candidapepsin-10 [Spathaspora sp. JA1]